MEPKTYEKEAKQNKNVKAETKQTNKNQGFWVAAHARKNRPAFA